MLEAKLMWTQWLTQRCFLFPYSTTSLLLVSGLSTLTINVAMEVWVVWFTPRHWSGFNMTLLSTRGVSCFKQVISPRPKGTGHIAFGADPVGVGNPVASCLRYISWTNRWILTKLAQTHYLKKGKKWLDFGDLDLIFKVLNQMTDSGQTSLIVTLGWS